MLESSKNRNVVKLSRTLKPKNAVINMDKRKEANLYGITHRAKMSLLMAEKIVDKPTKRHTWYKKYSCTYRVSRKNNRKRSLNFKGGSPQKKESFIDLKIHYFSSNSKYLFTAAWAATTSSHFCSWSNLGPLKTLHKTLFRYSNF